MQNFLNAYIFFCNVKKMYVLYFEFFLPSILIVKAQLSTERGKYS